MKDLINTIEEKDLPELNKFEWQDPLLLDTKLSDSERLLAKSVREFAEKNLMSRVEKAFQNEKVDLDVFKLMGESPKPGRSIEYTVNLSASNLPSLSEYSNLFLKV